MVLEISRPHLIDTTKIQNHSHGAIVYVCMYHMYHMYDMYVCTICMYLCRYYVGTMYFTTSISKNYQYTDTRNTWTAFSLKHLILEIGRTDALPQIHFGHNL